MEDYYDERQGKKDIPHRHDYYTVLLVKKASGIHYIDFNEYELAANQVFFVSPGQIHDVAENEKSYGYIMIFSTQFLINNNIPVSFIEDLNLFNNYGNSSPLELNSEQKEKLSQFCEETIHYFNSDLKFREQAIGAFLKLFLIQCNNHCSLPQDNPQIIQAGHSILKKFKIAVEENHTQWHSTSQYADHLNITPDHLNRSIKSLIGKTAKEYIQARICIAAKRLLYYSDLTTKEISFRLGFSEASNFSAFFKKCAETSPTDYRKTR
jgi:AraC-like DNA-binding protein